MRHGGGGGNTGGIQWGMYTHTSPVEIAYFGPGML